MLSKQERVLIKLLRVEKGHGAKRIMTEFPGRNWLLASVKHVLHQTEMTGSADCKSDSGLHHSACSGTNVQLVKKLALSQEDAPLAGATAWVSEKTGDTLSINLMVRLFKLIAAVCVNRIFGGFI